METLPITPELPLQCVQEYRTVRTEFSNGVFQSRAAWPHPRRRWTLVWNVATPSEAETLQAFVRSHLGAATPFYWSPPKPICRPYSGPVLGQVVGGALGARTRYAAFTWADATANETTPSYVTTTLAVSSGYLLTATVPEFPASVTRAWVYVGATAGALHKQATAVTTTAGIWTEPTGGYDSGGAAPPTTNALTETVTVCFIDDLHAFDQVNATYFSYKATVLEVL